MADICSMADFNKGHDLVYKMWDGGKSGYYVMKGRIAGIEQRNGEEVCTIEGSKRQVATHNALA